MRRRSDGGMVLVDEATEVSPPADPVDRDRFGRLLIDAGGGVLIDAVVGPVVVVVHEVLDEQFAELLFVPDQPAVEQFGSGGAHETFSGGIGAGRSGWASSTGRCNGPALSAQKVPSGPGDVTMGTIAIFQVLEAFFGGRAPLTPRTSSVDPG